MQSTAFPDFFGVKFNLVNICKTSLASIVIPRIWSSLSKVRVNFQGSNFSFFKSMSSDAISPPANSRTKLTALLIESVTPPLSGPLS